MDKIKLDSFIDIYLIGSLSSLNIRLDINIDIIDVIINTIIL